MYQISDINGQKLINGYAIVVIGRGENGLCRIDDGNGQEKFRGTYSECVSWLTSRSMLVSK